ncbi:calponin homology (CH) domain-containing protein [Ditylenchus destructor]|nr:calponin homology (CH) domain-containing protein [Ditylenchus destructor]
MLDYYGSRQQPYYKPVCEYTQPEEEWDRDALLDPAWERQQKKTFTAWCNSHLRKAGTGIQIIEEDFQNGLKLMLLLEVISGETLKRPDRGRMRFHKIANVNKALEYIESKGVKLVSIGAEEIVDGKVKMTLGLIWTIILRFAIQDISVGELSAKDGLLLWCQRQTAPYDNVKVQNFHTSWKDGLAFCALIHRHRPDLIDYNRLSRNNPMHNLNLAFDVAEKQFDIPKMLDAEDLCFAQKPEEKSIITYLSCLYHAFQMIVETAIPDEKAIMTYVSSYYYRFLEANKSDTASSRICRIVSFARELDEMKEQYESLASNLLDWIEMKTSSLKNQSEASDVTLENIRRKTDDYRQYQVGEKPSRLEEKSKLLEMYKSIETKRRLHKHAPFTPSKGLLIEIIAKAWTELERAEKWFESWLSDERNRVERLNALAEKFRKKCHQHEKWISGKEDALKSDNYKLADFAKIKKLQKHHDVFKTELNAHESDVHSISKIGRELRNLGYLQIEDVNKKCAKVCDDWEHIRNLADNREQMLKDTEIIAEEIDNLHLTFAKCVIALNSNLDRATEDIDDLVPAQDLEQLSRLIEDHNRVKKVQKDVEETLSRVFNIETQISDIIKQHSLHTTLQSNPYTDITTEVLKRKLMDLQSYISVRDTVLRDEQTRQQSNERICNIFVENANNIGEWLGDNLQDILKENKFQTLEESTKLLKIMDQNLQTESPKLNELTRLNQDIQDNSVFPAKINSRYTSETLKADWDALKKTTTKTITEFENHILKQSNKNISDDKLNEYRTSFNYFDKEQQGLDEDQLRACLISLGYIRGNGLDNYGDDIRKIMTKISPYHQGRISLQNFLDFMTREVSEADGLDQLIDSFRILADGKPFINVEKLKSEIPASQVDYCLKEMERFRDTTHHYDYVAFCRNMYNN